MSTDLERHYTKVVADHNLEELRDILVSKDSKLSNRFRALFNFKTLAENKKDEASAKKAIEYMYLTFGDDSELLKHEVAYVMGQTENLYAAPFLRKVMLDAAQQPMVRHEAAEALGALGDKDSIEDLQKCLSTDPHPAVIQTAELALARIQWEHSKDAENEKLQQSLYSSTDPAPPLSLEKDFTIDQLKTLLNDQKQPLFDRYRAMFRLRDIGTPEAVSALASGFDDPSALFKHEIAYVFGQMGAPSAVPRLVEVLARMDEAPMVRHEAAEALGAIATPDVVPVLKHYLNDPVDVVRESAIVALDMYEYENSNELEYDPENK